jgi:hypothetical protein
LARESEADRQSALLSAIDSFSEQAYGSDNDGDLSRDRALAIERYLGRNIDPAPVGTSQVRDRTTFEVVEWTKPSLLRIFTSGSEVCRFDPQGPEDEELSAQESDYVNYVLTQRNNWHQLCNDWFSDALLLKNGYTHAYWDESAVVESEFYENLTDDAFALLARDSEIDIVAHSQRPNVDADQRNAAAYQQAIVQYQQQAQAAQVQAMQSGQPPQIPPPPPQPQPAFLHDCELKRTRKRGSVCLRVLAPERCLVDINASDCTLASANYFEYYDFSTIGALRRQGFTVDDTISDARSDRFDRYDNEVERARDLYNESDATRDPQFADPSMRSVRVRYIWIRHDYDGDGIDELQYVILVGDTVLSRRESEEIPVASISPIPLAHRHIGMSLADTVADIEDINTNLTRAAINNINLSNTPRIAVSDRVNMADLLDVRVGGVIRVDGQPPQEFMPVTVPNTFPDAVGAIGFFDSRRQNRTGINAYFQGTDSNALNKTASGISQLTNSAAQRVEMIARLFATGVERLFLIVHRLILQHGHAEEVIKLRNKWVTIDPTQWRKRSDVKISVGLGTGNKDSMLAQLTGMFQMQMAAAPVGIVQPQNLYATLIEIAKAASLSNPDKFVTDPSTLPPQPPQPPLPLLIEQMKQQGEAQQTQAKLAADQQQVQTDMQFKQWQAQQQFAFDKWKTEFEAQVQFQIEQMKIAGSAETEMRRIGSTEAIKAAEFQRADSERAESSNKDAALSNMVQQFNELQSAMQQVIQSVGGSKVVGIERIRDPKTGRMIAARAKRADGSTEEITIQ